MVNNLNQINSKVCAVFLDLIVSLSVFQFRPLLFAFTEITYSSEINENNEIDYVILI